jgi:NitT/TauT family transport system ATP-binding protein
MTARNAPQTPLLEAAGLCLDYDNDHGPVRAVDRVSFALVPGERLVLLGPSGCGKSSILKALAGFIAPSEGEIRLRGRPIAGPGPDRIVVFQEFDQLLPWKTVRENVAFPLKVARGQSAAAARATAESALHDVGLGHALDAYPHTLSGGMKQRAAIARALAAAPDILLMDEPFAALDALTRRTLQDDLLRLAEARRFTLVFVTHAIDEAVLIGTRLHLLSTRPGRTLASFSTADPVFRRPDTAEFQAQVRDIHTLLFGHTAEAAA